MRGNVDSVIGTAPFSPTHEMNVSSRQLNPKGNADSQTATGRATNIRTRLTRMALPLTSNSRLGKHNKPSVTNMTICDSQASAS